MPGKIRARLAGIHRLFNPPAKPILASRYGRKKGSEGVGGDRRDGRTRKNGNAGEDCGGVFTEEGCEAGWVGEGVGKVGWSQIRKGLEIIQGHDTIGRDKCQHSTTFTVFERTSGYIASGRNRMQS